MYGTFLGINTALRGLLAQQAALDVTGHNLANVNTEGYSRQRAEMVTAPTLSMPGFNMVNPGAIGTGVDISGFSRLRDTYLDVTMRQAMSRFGSATTTLGSMQQVEGVFGEPSDHALAATLQKFFSALDDVAAHPDSMPARQTFAQAADALATDFRQLSADLTSVSLQSDAKLNAAVTDINSITQRIATLNTEIRESVSMGLNPNDLRDERDKLMDELATKVNYTYTTNANDEVTITFGVAIPINVVDPAVPPGFTALTRADLDTAYANGDLTGGECFGDEEMFNTTIPGYITRLDDLVNSIVSQMNLQHSAGFDLNGNPGGNIFDPAGVTAATITLDPLNNIMTDPTLIAAASSWAAPGEPGNGDNANAILALRNTVWGAPLNATWEDFYGMTVASLGTATQAVERTVMNEGAVLGSLEARRQSVSGVSVDEEMSNMLKFQHAYNAAARVMTAFDEVLDTLINRTGRVGI